MDAPATTGVTTTPYLSIYECMIYSFLLDKTNGKILFPKGNPYFFDSTCSPKFCRTNFLYESGQAKVLAKIQKLGHWSAYEDADKEEKEGTTLLRVP